MRQFFISHCHHKTRSSIILFLLITVAACSGRSEDGSDQANTIIQADDVAQVSQTNANQLEDNAWLLGSYHYVAETSGQRAGDNNTMFIIASTLVHNAAHGYFSGAGLAISMTDSGAGVYALTDHDGVMAAASSGSAALSLNVNAGLNNTDPAVASRWSTLASTGTATVIQTDEGRYIVSIIDPVVLSREIDFGDGIPNSSDQMQFVMKNISGNAM